MFRHGLISFILLLFFFANWAQASPKAKVHSKKKNFIQFKEGVSLLRLGRVLKAQSKIRRSLEDDFLLKDYSYMLLAETHKRLGDHEKALEYVQKAKSIGEAVSVHYSQRLSGEILAAMDDHGRAFEHFYDFLSKKTAFVKEGEIIPKLTEAYLHIEDSNQYEKKYLEKLVVYLKKDLRFEKEDSQIPFLDDFMQVSGFGYDNLRIYESSGMHNWVIKRLRERALWNEDNQRELLAFMSTATQSLKNYKLKVKILKETMRFARSRHEKAGIQFSLGFAYLNMNMDNMALKYFRESSENAGKSFLRLQSDYYIGRIYEFIGDSEKAASNYRKAKKALHRNEDELNFIIKSLFRAGWVSYKAKDYKRAEADFAYIREKYGNKLTEEGYAYWLGITLLKRDKRKEALDVFESFYRDYPTSYYGLLCALEIYKNFSTEIVLDKFKIEDFVRELSAENERIIQRSLLLFMAGFDDFARAEFSRIKINYRSTGEVYTIAIVSMLLDNYVKAISLIDFLINKEKQMPSDDILKIYYPLKYMSAITHLSKTHNVDPFMVVSLIRQESVFHVDAISRARAMGLMQVIPSLGKKVAGILDLGDISERSLLDPGINLKVGIYHLGELMQKFNGNFVYSAAAYNSSEAKVKEWTKRFGNPPLFEFIEEIPFFETRKYVKLVLRNYFNYHRLYTDTDWLTLL